MKSLHVWIVGGILALAAGARFGTAMVEQGIFPGSLFVALSPVYSSASQSETSSVPAQVADIAVLQTGTTPVVQRNTTGDTSLTYGFAISNKGPLAATNVHIVFPVPVGLVFDAASLPDCVFQNDAVHCTFASFPNGQTLYPVLKFHLPVPVETCQSRIVQYRVFAWSDMLDTQFDNNQFVATTSINCPQVSSSASSAVSSASSAAVETWFSSASSWETWSSAQTSSSTFSSSSSFASQAADISLRTVTTPIFKPGDIITYDVYAKNNGPQNATNVVLAFYVPFGAAASYVADKSDARCGFANGNTVITCNLGALAVNADEVSVRIAVQISASYMCNGDFWSQVIAGSSPQDFNQTNSRVILKSAVQCGAPLSTVSSSISSRISSAAVSSSSSRFSSIASIPPSSAASVSSAFDVVLVSNVTPVINKGDVAFYDLTAHNNGPATADLVTVSIAAPFNSNAFFVPEQSTPGCLLADNKSMVTCTLGRLSPGQEMSVRIAARLQLTCDSNFNVQVLTNNLYYDQNQTNNRAIVATKITCSSSSSSTVTTGPSSVNPNARVDVQVVQAYTNAKVAQAGTIVHAFTVDNNGPDVAQNVVLTESIPSGFSYIDAQSDSRCDQVGSNVACTINSIAPYEPLTLKIALKAGVQQPCGIVTGTVAMTSAGQEINTFNNTITAQTKVLCVSAAKWNVVVQPAGDAGSAAKGQKNVPLMRFTVTPDRDTVFTGVRFAAAVGSVQNAQTYALRMDMDYNGTTESYLKAGVVPSNGVVTFTDLPGGGQIISAGATMAFEVQADIAQNPVSNRLQIMFDTATPDYLNGEATDGALTKVGTNGICPAGNGACQISVVTAPSKLWTISSAGNLFITKDTEATPSHQLLAGTLADSVLRLTLRSTNEDIEVNKLQISTWDSTAVSVDQLELYRPWELAPFAIATTAACGSDPVPTINQTNGKNIRTFCAVMTNRELVAVSFEERDVIVRPLLNTDEDGAISGESLIFWLPQTGAVKARGLTSTNILSDNDGDAAGEGEVFVGTAIPASGMNIVGNANQVALGKITSITNAGSNPGLVIAYPNQEIGRYRFTAAANNNTRNGLNRPVITDIIFSVKMANLTIDPATFRIAASLNYTVRQNCNVVEGGEPDETLVECRNLFYKADPYIDLSLQVDVTGGAPTGAWIQSSLKNFSNVNNIVFGPYPGQTRLRWLDTDSSSTEFLWAESVDPVIYSTKYNKISQ